MKKSQSSEETIISVLRQTEAGMNGISELALNQGLEVSEIALQHHAGDNLVGWRMHLARL